MILISNVLIMVKINITGTIFQRNKKQDHPKSSWQNYKVL